MKRFLAVFDWNGTLLDDAEPTLAGHNACLEYFDKLPTDIDTFRSVEHIPLSHLFYHYNVPIDTYLAHFEASGEIYGKAYRETCRARQTGLRRGATELLDWLESQGAILTVLSNHIQDRLEVELIDYELHGRFAAISGNPDRHALASSLSKLERLGEMLDTFGIDAKDCFIIGDTAEELRAATHHGAIGVGILNGMASAELLQKHHPDILINELDELPAQLALRWSFLSPPANFAETSQQTDTK